MINGHTHQSVNGPRLNSPPYIIVKIYLIWRKNANFGQKHSWFDDNFSFSSVHCTGETGPGPFTATNLGVKDEEFPDATIADAQNYWRNPNSILQISWCYVNATNYRWEVCLVLNCNSKHNISKGCKNTRTGADYQHSLHKNGLGIVCLPWTKLSLTTEHESYFPDENLDDAVNYCRNPKMKKKDHFVITKIQREVFISATVHYLCVVCVMSSIKFAWRILYILWQRHLCGIKQILFNIYFIHSL